MVIEIGYTRPEFENRLNHHGSIGEKIILNMYSHGRGGCGQNIINLSVLSFLVSSNVTQNRAYAAHLRLPSIHILCSVGKGIGNNSRSYVLHVYPILFLQSYLSSCENKQDPKDISVQFLLL